MKHRCRSTHRHGERLLQCVKDARHVYGTKRADQYHAAEGIEWR